MNRWGPLAVTLRQLQYAVAVMETGGFGRAAQQCSVSQPSLSAQVAKLEEQLGVRLFERHGRGVHLTAMGRALIPQMRSVIVDAHALEAKAAALSDPYAAVLRVGVIPTVAPYLIPGVVDGLRRRGRIRVHWLELQTGVCEGDLANGDIDAMIIADPPTVAGVHHQALGWEPFMVVTPLREPTSGPMTLQRLAELELMLLEDGHCLRDQTMSLCMQPGAAESSYRATSLPTLVQMVASGLGVTVIPAMAVPVEAQRARVRVMPLAQKDVGRTLYLAWRIRSPHLDLLHELAGVVTTAFRPATYEEEGWGREEEKPQREPGP